MRGVANAGAKFFCIWIAGAWLNTQWLMRDGASSGCDCDSRESGARWSAGREGRAWAGLDLRGCGWRRCGAAWCEVLCEIRSWPATRLRGLRWLALWRPRRAARRGSIRRKRRQSFRRRAPARRTYRSGACRCGGSRPGSSFRRLVQSSQRPWRGPGQRRSLVPIRERWRRGWKESDAFAFILHCNSLRSCQALVSSGKSRQRS